MNKRQRKKLIKKEWNLYGYKYITTNNRSFIAVLRYQKIKTFQEDIERIQRFAPAICAFERWTIEEYQPVTNKIKILKKEGKDMTEKIRIKYFTDKIDKLQYIDGKSDWIDLRSAADIEMKAGEFKLIPLGIAMELPSGYEAHVVPRSSTFKNFGIIQTNSMGIIDESYCGDNDQWFFPAYALNDTIIHINDRICQFRIMLHQPTINFEETDILNHEDRGGHGSTGKQ